MSHDRIGRRAFLGAMGRAGAGLAATGAMMHFGAGCGTSGGGGGGGYTGPLNFVFILIDDMGWTDLACYGSGYYQTPHIDTLASGGMKFTDAYAACTVCSPTRASIMTGKYPARLHLTDWIPGHTRTDMKLLRPEFEQQLPLAEVTIAEALKAQGYATAHIGKWHLGDVAYYPDQQGFDVNIAGTHKGQPHNGYFSPYGIPTLLDGPVDEYLTDRMGADAATWIEKHKDEKFFLYLSHFAVHTPIQAKQELIDKYAALPTSGGHTNATYAAMIESVDDTVGQVMAKLDELSISDRTVVIFMSDNGGLAGVTSNAPLRAGKGTNYEGGVREPMIVKWPGAVAAGSVCDAPVISVDFYPTMCEIAGITPPVTVDGESIVPLLKGTGSLARESIYWHYPHYHTSGGTPHSAIRKGDYRLLLPYETGRPELYNLADDVGETSNLVDAEPAKAAELLDDLAAHLVDCSASMPIPNAAWTGTWTRADVEFWTDLRRRGLVADADVKQVVKFYREG